MGTLLSFLTVDASYSMLRRKVYSKRCGGYPLVVSHCWLFVQHAAPKVIIIASGVMDTLLSFVTVDISYM